MEYLGNIIYDEMLLESDEGFVIYGAGKYGRMILEYLEMNKKRSSILCFCDENLSDLKNKVDGIPVISPKMAFQMYPDAHFLVSGKYADEMLQECIENNLKKIHYLFV